MTAGTPSTAASDDIVADSPTIIWAMGEQVVDVLDRALQVVGGEILREWRLGGDEHLAVALERHDEVGLLLPRQPLLVAVVHRLPRDEPDDRVPVVGGDAVGRQPARVRLEAVGVQVRELVVARAYVTCVPRTLPW